MPPVKAKILEIIEHRTSCRAYRTDPVPPEYLQQILESARLAPSACNQQPWRFVVVRRQEIRRRIVEEGFLPGFRMQWALDAPVHLVLGMKPPLLTHTLGASVSGVDYPWLDIGIAGEHMVLTASELGLGSCWIGWIKPRRIAQIVAWPKNIKAVAVLTLGYPQENRTPPLPASRRLAMEDLVRYID